LSRKNSSGARLSPVQAELLTAAAEARRLAYAPYSKFAVGAAIRTHDGRVYTGCNVENASYGLSLCAERVALFKAVSDGHRQFSHIAIHVDAPLPSPPCGACRQVIAEFAGDPEIIMGTVSGKIEMTHLGALFPMAFRLAARTRV
jgi:cytidine deaminase